MKINNILLILISLLISIPSMANKMKNESLSEQQDSKIQDRQNTFWEMLVRNASVVNATGKPYPEANNWTLSYTGTYGQYTCKHYEHNGRGLRVYYKKDGSFITLPESSSGSNAPSDYYEEGIGEFLLKLKDGSILHGGIDDTEFVIRQNYDEENAPWKYVKVKSARLILPTGDSYYFEIEGSLVWSAFDSADIKPSGYVIGYTFAENPTKRYPYIRCESSIRYVGSKKKPNIDLSPTSFRGILVNDRIYVWDHSKNNIGNATYQIFNNIVVPAAACDTVTAVEMRGVTDGFKVTYTRGDFAEFDGGGSVENASLHREGGIFTVRTVQYNPQFRLTYPDKSFFKGSFYELFTDYFEHYKFGLESFTPKTGIYVYPDGTTSNLTDGKNDRELAEEKAAYEAAEKRAAAAKAKAETEAWVTLSKKYGKTYCDYLRKNMQPCVGMPIDLVVGFFDCRLVYTSGYIKFYRLYGKYYGRDGGHYGALQGIYVRNGRVSSILNYRR